MKKIKSLEFKGGRLFILDQTQLPQKEIYLEIKSLKSAYWAIKKLKVRGAPLIGVFSAYALFLSVKNLSGTKDEFFKKLSENSYLLQSSRPTAVNLFWAQKRMQKKAELFKNKSVLRIKQELLKEAKAIHEQDVRLCLNIGSLGAKLIKENDRILTHCNTGFLATSGIGTALGVIYQAYERSRNIKVYVDETRPLLQGARLTAWELRKIGVRAELICDNTAGFLMQKKEIDKIIVGADRITAKGDVANKIGTYSLAVLARYHKVPFYVAAPLSSFDLNLKRGEEIPIEERKELEVKKVLGKFPIAPQDVKAKNFAFDITPHNLITALITDKGIIYPPFEKNIKKVL